MTDDTGEQIKAVKDNAARIGLTWQIIYATVSDGSDPKAVTIVFDGDTDAVIVPAVSLVGPCLNGSRVAVITVPPAGTYIISQINSTMDLLAWGERTTSSTPAAGLQGVLRLDSIPITSGHQYLICTSNLLATSTVAGDVATVRLTHVAAAVSTIATTASPSLITTNTAAIPAAGDVAVGPLSRIYEATITGFLSVLLLTSRLSGAGNVSITGSTSIRTQIHAYHLSNGLAGTGVAI